MASTSEIISILIKADGKAAVRELEKVGGAAERELGKANKATRDWSATFTRAGSVLVTGAAAVGVGLFKMAQAADESALAQAKLENTLRNAPQLAGKSADAFYDLAAAIGKTTAVDDDAVVGIEAFLGSVGRTKTEILALVPLIVDLSRKTGTDLNSAAAAVNKSVDGSARALRGLGVDVDAAAAKADGFNATMEALQQSVGGFARDEAETFTGQMQILKNQLGEIAEGVGAGVAPVLSDLADITGSLTGRFQELSPATQDTVGKFAAYATIVGGATGVVSLFAGQLAKLKERLLVDPAAGLRGGLNKFGKVAAGASAAAGVLGIAWIAMSENAEDAERRVGALTDAVKLNGETLGEASSRGLRDYLAENEKAGSVLDALGLSITDVNKAIQGSDAEFNALKESVVDLNDPLEQGAEYNAKLGVQAQLAATELKRQREAFLSAKKEIGRYNEATDELRGKTGDGATAVADLGDEAETAAAKTDKAAEAAKRYTERISGLFDEIDRRRQNKLDTGAAREQITKGSVDLIRAQEGLLEAQAKYNEAVATSGANSEEAREAQRELQDAYIGVSDALRSGKADIIAYGETVRENTQGGLADKIYAQVTALETVRDRLAPGSALRRYLDDYIRRLKEDIPSQVATELLITARIDQTGRFNEARDARAIGGPVSTGTSYLVGERGPEIFRPSTPGVIVPNNQLRTNTGGGDTINITVNAGAGTDSVELEQAVIRALANARRRGIAA